MEWAFSCHKVSREEGKCSVNLHFFRAIFWFAEPLSYHKILLDIIVRYTGVGASPTRHNLPAEHTICPLKSQWELIDKNILNCKE